MKTNKLHEIWIDKITKGENITIKDLYRFSNVKLKRKRMRKKFHKYYERYIPKNIKETYWGICMVSPLFNTFYLYSKLDFITMTPIKDLPKGNLVYFDNIKN